MLFQRNRTTLRYIAVLGILTSFFLLSVFFLSCDRIQRVVAPEGVEIPDSAAAVKIGFIYSPSDPGTTRKGAELAVALANAAGGINGLPIELLIRDDITPTAIRDQIEATQNYSGATILSHFDENRHAVKSLVINTVKDGEIQFHRFIAP